MQMTRHEMIERLGNGEDELDVSISKWQRLLKDLPNCWNRYPNIEHHADTCPLCHMYTVLGSVNIECERCPLFRVVGKCGLADSNPWAKFHRAAVNGDLDGMKRWAMVMLATLHEARMVRDSETLSGGTRSKYARCKCESNYDARALTFRAFINTHIGEYFLTGVYEGEPFLVTLGGWKTILRALEKTTTVHVPSMSEFVHCAGFSDVGDCKHFDKCDVCGDIKFTDDDPRYCEIYDAGGDERWCSDCISVRVEEYLKRMSEDIYLSAEYAVVSPRDLEVDGWVKVVTGVSGEPGGVSDDQHAVWDVLGELDPCAQFLNVKEAYNHVYDVWVRASSVGIGRLGGVWESINDLLNTNTDVMNDVGLLPEFRNDAASQVCAYRKALARVVSAIEDVFAEADEVVNG